MTLLILTLFFLMAIKTHLLTCRISKDVHRIKNILKHKHIPDQPIAVDLFFIINGHRKTDMINVKDDLPLNFSIEADDKFGNPVAITEAPVFALSDDSFGSIVDNDDGSKSFVSNGKLGIVQLQASIGALSGQLDMNIIAGSAVSLKINASQD